MGVWGPGSGRGVGRRPHKGLMRPKAQHRAPPLPAWRCQGLPTPQPRARGSQYLLRPPSPTPTAPLRLGPSAAVPVRLPRAAATRREAALGVTSRRCHVGKGAWLEGRQRKLRPHRPADRPPWAQYPGMAARGRCCPAVPPPSELRRLPRAGSGGAARPGGAERPRRSPGGRSGTSRASIGARHRAEPHRVPRCSQALPLRVRLSALSAKPGGSGAAWRGPGRGLGSSRAFPLSPFPFSFPFPFLFPFLFFSFPFPHFFPFSFPFPFPVSLCLFFLSLPLPFFSFSFSLSHFLSHFPFSFPSSFPFPLSFFFPFPFSLFLFSLPSPFPPFHFHFSFPFPSPSFSLFPLPLPFPSAHPNHCVH